MLFQTINLFQTDPALALITLAAFSLSLIVAITFHEFSHAYAAASLGDNTARAQGRLTLNPIAHLDPFGTILIFFAGFGWGKPTPVNPMYLRIGYRPGMAAVSLAGPVSNVIAAILFAIPLRAGLVESGAGGFSIAGYASDAILAFALEQLVFWNLLLAVFNLLPIAPLDGFKVALGLLPRAAANSFARLEPYGPGILLVIIALGFLSPNLRIFSIIISPILNFLSLVILGRPLM